MSSGNLLKIRKSIFISAVIISGTLPSFSHPAKGGILSTVARPLWKTSINYFDKLQWRNFLFDRE